MRRAIAIGVVLAAVAGAWWLLSRGGGAPAARDGADGSPTAGAPHGAAGLEVTVAR